MKLNPLTSDIVILIYIVATMYLRLNLESTVNLSPIISIVIGLIFIAVLWALIKIKFLSPNWFGLFNKKNNKHEL